MVYFRWDHSNTDPMAFDARVLEGAGRCVVSASSNVLFDSVSVRRPDRPCLFAPDVSIVICTYGRPESLNETLHSLCNQTFKNFEIILITEKGNLSELRDNGLRSAAGGIVSFIDDDVYCPPNWLAGVVEGFREGVVGVTGPTIITEEYRRNRDSIAFERHLKPLWRLFGVSDKPGHLSPTGAPSMASNFEGCQYQGTVDYLECCNMSVKRKEALDAGGFDIRFTGTGEWSEPDLSLKIAKKGALWFSPECRLYHRPSKQGIYTARLRTTHRWKNFMVFQRRYVRSSLKTYLYRGFVWLYFTLKTNRMI